MKMFVCILAGLLVGSAAVHAGPIPSSPIYTNKVRFRIPFHYDTEELKRLGAGEVRLYVSRDRGRGWQRTQALRPDAGKFNFQASGDGEYWFMVRTLDAKNREHPDASHTEVGLQVIVDTTAPRLQLELKQIAPGKVQLVWNATDEHLDPTQLRLEYIQPGTTDWEPVSVVPKAAGESTWSVPQGGIVAVRGSVSDFARNTANDQTQLNVAAANQAVPRPRAPAHRQPVAGNNVSPFDDQALSMPDQFPGTARTAAKPPAESNVARRGEVIPFAPMRAASDSSGPRNSFVSQRSDEFPGAPIIRGGKSPAKENEKEKATDQDPETPETAPDNRRVVNTRRFQIGYKLHDIDAAKVQAVELYITPDGGATWYNYGVDEDKQSPVQIEVREPGVYGFALGIASSGDPATDTPQNGDPPAFEVVVDETPPKIELLAPRQGRGRSADKILIEWKYSDDYPAEQPISLYYAEKAEGPWQKISDWTEDTGRYLWTVDASTPPKFLLRIEARDKAGNVETAQLPRPVKLNPTRPTATLGLESPQQNSPK
jgi:hypothetical protein